MESMTFAEVWAVIAAVAAAVILLANAAEKIVAIWHTIRAPDIAQDDRLANLERDVTKIKGYLENDKKRLNTLSEGDKMTKRSLLALLNHGIDGNNITQMKAVKKELEDYLIDR